jgi:hypothetical protein
MTTVIVPIDFAGWIASQELYKIYEVDTNLLIPVVTKVGIKDIQSVNTLTGIRKLVDADDVGKVIVLPGEGQELVTIYRQELHEILADLECSIRAKWQERNPRIYLEWDEDNSLWCLRVSLDKEMDNA